MDNFSFGIDFTPEFLEKYEILGTLGEGGMGQVYLGVQKSLNRKVAIKFLSGRVIMSERRIQKFNNEARLCAEMRHPNIVELYDFGGGTSPKDRPYMVFELIDGESLADRIKRAGKQSVRDALNFGIKICEGLEYAHEMGIVHRDMKSDNILLSKDGKVKVADFGIAVANQKEEEEKPQEEEKKKKDKFIPGTPAYMSPEQAKGEEATHLSDIYSTGIIMYEILAGKVPFTAETSMAIIIQHISNDPPSLCEINPDVPPQLEEVVFRALEKDQAARYQSAEEFKMKLKKAKTFSRRWRSTTSLKLDGSAEGGSSTRLKRSLSRSMSFVVQETPEEKMKRRVVYGGLGALALILLLIPIYLIFGPETPKVVAMSAKAGFTEAVIEWKCNVPSKGDIEYWLEGQQPKKKVVEDPAEAHSVRLSDLIEGGQYKYHINVADGETSKKGDFETLVCEFSELSKTPLVNGVEVKWRTSMPTKSEVRYLCGGEVKSRQRNNKVMSKHRFRVAVGDSDRDREIQMVAILEGDFKKTKTLGAFRIIDKQVILRLTEALVQAEPDRDEDFTPSTKKRFSDAKLTTAMEDFVEFKDDFWESADVAPVDKWQLYKKLLLLREYDFYSKVSGMSFHTNVEKVLHKYFLEVNKNPFSKGSPFTALDTPVTIMAPVGEQTLAQGCVEEKSFTIRQPGGHRWRRACIEVKHKGFTSLGFIDISTGDNHLALFGKGSASGTVPAGTLYHTFDPRLIKSSGSEFIITFYPLRGLTSALVRKYKNSNNFKVQITSIKVYFIGR